jgi:HK97 family phage major capsid protein
MPIVEVDTQIGELTGQAQKLRSEAKTLLIDPNCNTEQFAKAEKMRADAEILSKRASELVKIKLADAAPLPQAEAAQTPQSFKSWRDYMGAISRAQLSKGRVVDPRLKTIDDLVGPDGVKVMTGQTGSGGGFLIEPMQMAELMAVSAPMNVIRPRATVIPMSSRALPIPALDQSGTDAADHFFGGVQVYWTEEAGDATESDAKFRMIDLIVRELVGSTRAGNSLLKDVPALAAFLSSQRGFPGAMANAENKAFLRGNGNGKPIGILNAAATKIVSRTTPSTIKYDDLVNMDAAFLGENPVWIASVGAKATLMLMNGPSGNPSYVWGDATAGRPDRLLGHEILFVEVLPGVGTKGDLMLVDASYYLIGDLEDGTSLESSEHEKFGKNQTVFRIVKRVDGKPWLNAPLTLEDGATTLSPFVVLAT